MLDSQVDDVTYVDVAEAEGLLEDWMLETNPDGRFEWPLWLDVRQGPSYSAPTFAEGIYRCRAMVLGSDKEGNIIVRDCRCGDHVGMDYFKSIFLIELVALADRDR